MSEQHGYVVQSHSQAQLWADLTVPTTDLTAASAFALEAKAAGGRVRIVIVGWHSDEDKDNTTTEGQP